MSNFQEHDVAPSATHLSLTTSMMDVIISDTLLVVVLERILMGVDVAITGAMSAWPIGLDLTACASTGFATIAAIAQFLRHPTLTA